MLNHDKLMNSGEPIMDDRDGRAGVKFEYGIIGIPVKYNIGRDAVNSNVNLSQEQKRKEILTVDQQ